VSTFQECRRIARGEELLHADSTVLLESIHLALVVVFKSHAHTTSTYIAMKSVFSSANPTDPTFIAVEYFLFQVFIVVKLADVTVISSED